MKLQLEFPESWCTILRTPTINAAIGAVYKAAAECLESNSLATSCRAWKAKGVIWDCTMIHKHLKDFLNRVAEFGEVRKRCQALLLPGQSVSPTVP
jgi:hypothetical protein